NAIYHLELHEISGWGDTPETRKRYDQLRRALAKECPTGYWNEKLKQTDEDDFYWKAVATVHLGKTNEALNLLEKSCAAHEHWPGSYDGPLHYLLLDAHWDGLHNSPRFKAVLDKIGFPKVPPPPKF